jgi:hypothetical protein
VVSDKSQGDRAVRDIGVSEALQPNDSPDKRPRSDVGNGHEHHRAPTQPARPRPRPEPQPAAAIQGEPAEGTEARSTPEVTQTDSPCEVPDCDGPRDVFLKDAQRWVCRDHAAIWVARIAIRTVGRIYG